MLTKGKCGTAQIEVTGNSTAKAVGSGSLEVFSTPMMIAVMEQAACQCISDVLQDTQTSVGTNINVSHVAASPVGAIVNAVATITEIEGRKLIFSVTANDGKNEIGHGTHERIIVDSERFLSKL